MKIAIFGSSISSTHANGATTFFRGMCKALSEMGLAVTFLEEEQPHLATYRDHLADIGEVKVVPYRADGSLVDAIQEASLSDVVIKFSECGTLDRRIEQMLICLRSPDRQIVFADGDAPLNLENFAAHRKQYLKALIPYFDSVLVFAGGPSATEGYLRLGARRTAFLYAAADPRQFSPGRPSADFACDLVFVGNRLHDRDERVRELFLGAAEENPLQCFMLGGSGWEDVKLPVNVKAVGHLQPSDLRAAYVSARFVLNINRPAMVRYGYSPPSRLFEAAACEACIISDYWQGLETVLVPGREILLADSPSRITAILNHIDEDTASKIGLAARQRFLRDHTCGCRARELVSILTSLWSCGAS